MPGKYGSASSTTMVQFDSTPGGSLANATAHIRSIGGLKIEQITEENSPFGMAYETNTPVGKQKFGDVTIEGDWDTTASTGSHAIFGTPDTDPNGSTRTLTITPGDSKTLTCECRLVSYELKMTDGKLTGYAAVIRQAGLAAWS
jgi:hypothetical protein